MNKVEDTKIRCQCENMSIFELRNYARYKGVQQPTTKLKSELIDLIIQIEKGELEPHNNFTLGKGRPPKCLINYDQIVNPNEYQLLDENKKLKQILKSVYDLVKNIHKDNE